MWIKVKRRLGYCDRCAAGKGIYKPAAKLTLNCADHRLHRLFADLAGLMAMSTVRAQYCPIIADDATNMSWPVFLPDKSAATVTRDFRTFLAANNAYRTPTCLHTENSFEFTKKEFQTLISDNSIRREYTTVDGPKSNKWAEQKLVLVVERRMAAFLVFHLMFDGVELPARSYTYVRTWSEAWTWVCDALNIMDRIDEKTAIIRPFEKLH